MSYRWKLAPGCDAHLEPHPVGPKDLIYTQDMKVLTHVIYPSGKNQDILF